MSRITSRDVTVTIEDGSGKTMELGPGPGDLSIGGWNDGNTEKTPVYNRGRFDGLVEGQDTTQDVSITVHLRREAITDEATARALDLVSGNGYWADAVSTGPGGPVKCYRVIVSLGSHGTITLPCVNLTASWSESAEGVAIAVSGVNYQQPVLA